MKKSSLMVEISWKLAVLVICGMFVSSFVSIKTVSKDVRKTFIDSQKDMMNRVDIALRFRANGNMQQMRSYTMLDDIGRTSSNPVEIQEMLIRRAPQRQKNFAKLAYVEYKTGLAYFDDGKIENVSSQEYFKTMKNNNLGQYCDKKL
ncbi:MAG: hypothetical protein K6F69_07625 [Treponema sp.]|nr:hypothetical protein [Treponema sp.]